MTIRNCMAVIIMGMVSTSFAMPPLRSLYSSVLPLYASAWLEIDEGSGATLENDVSGSLYFDFPTNASTDCGSTASCNSINYLYSTHVPKTISGSLSITFRVDSGPNTTWWYNTNPNNTCAFPASVRAFIWASNNSYADGYRWWSASIYYALEAGTVTLTIPLDPSLWSGVYGEFANASKKTISKWRSALNNVSSLGITFGGGCFFGHGVYVEGDSARFTLTDFRVLP